MEKLVLLGIYALYTVVYLLTYYLFTGKCLQRTWVYPVGGAAVVGIAFAGAGWRETSVTLLVVIVVFVCTFAAMQESITQRIFLFFTLVFFDNCMGGFWSALIMYLRHWEVIEVITNRYHDTFLECLLETVSILAICLGKRRREKHGIRKQSIAMGNMQYLILSISFFISVAVSTLNFIQKEIHVSWFYNMIAALVLMAFIGLLLLSFFIIFIRNMNERLEQELETEKEYMILQEKYYENLLKQENDTRKFRHDLNNHLICLSQLASLADPDKIQKYIENMQEGMQKLSVHQRPSGNHIVDILTSHYARQLGEQAKIELNGQLSEELSVKDMQLCTIYGNLIANAVEAQAELPEDERRLRICFQEGQEYVRITMENRMKDAVSADCSGRIRSQKEDMKNHGFGLHNVERVLNENRGKLEWSAQDGWFRATVTWEK